jgi:hypothetical protein
VVETEAVLITCAADLKATHISSYTAFTFHIYNLGTSFLAATEDRVTLLQTCSIVITSLRVLTDYSAPYGHSTHLSFTNFRSLFIQSSQNPPTKLTFEIKRKNSSLREIFCSHSGVYEESTILGCYSVLSGKELPTHLPQPAESSSPRRVTVKADSHIACRAHAVPLPCRAAKGLECVFPI